MSWYTDVVAANSADLLKAGQGQLSGPTPVAGGGMTAGNANIISLLQSFAQNAGINTGLPDPNQAVRQGNNGPVTVGGAPYAPGQAQQPQQPYQQMQQQNQAQQQHSPYALNPQQSQALNQSIDRINKQAQVDLSTVTQDLTAKGITGAPLVAAQQQLREHYNQMSSETQTKFYETVQQQKQQEIASLLKAFTGLQEAGISGLTNVGQIHETTARQESSQFGEIINDLIGGAGSIAGAVTGVPGTSPAMSAGGGGFDYNALLNQFGVSNNELFTNQDRTLAGEGSF